MAYVSRGFHGRRAKEREGARLPPGQYLSQDFPVLSAGPTPYTPLAEWSFTIESETEPLRRWSWDAFRSNAMAGVLGEVFVRDMTAARIACGGCGRVEPVGAEHAYTQAPGIVMRCCHCDGVLLVVTQIGETYRVGLGNARWVEWAEGT